MAPSTVVRFASPLLALALGLRIAPGLFDRRDACRSRVSLYPSLAKILTEPTVLVSKIASLRRKICDIALG